MTARLTRLGLVGRTVAWPVLLGGGVICVVVIVVSPLARGSQGAWPGFGALALCVGAAFVLDDAAGATVGATPRSLARRRLARIALALPLLGAVWAASLWYATAAQGAWLGPDARLGLSLQFAAMLAVTLAASAVALRIMPDEHGGWTGVLAPFAIFGAAVLLPERWGLIAAPGNATWEGAQQRWWALLAIGLVTLAWASRDPAARGRGLRPPRDDERAGIGRCARDCLISMSRTRSLDRGNRRSTGRRRRA